MSNFDIVKANGNFSSITTTFIDFVYFQHLTANLTNITYADYGIFVRGRDPLSLFADHIEINTNFCN